LTAESFDLSIVNGIYNLNPYRTHVFQELGRVVKTGRTVWSAEIILNEPLPDPVRAAVHLPVVGPSEFRLWGES
jgi:hypothetical protein